MASDADTRLPASSGDTPGFFSSTRSLSLLPGPRFAPDAVAGYAIDLRSKAKAPTFPPEWAPLAKLYVAYTQWGLGAYDRFLEGDGDEWLAAAGQCGEFLLAEQAPDGGFVHTHVYPHTFRLQPPWLSGIAQGQAASLFVRLHAATGDERFADAALRALTPLEIPSREGGVLAHLEGGIFPEEYPTDPPSFVLNGALFALFGLHDVSIGLGDAAARARYDESVATIARTLHRWDIGWWSRYDLFPHRLPNIASAMYHRLHISQLDVLGRISPQHRQIAHTRDRFTRYERRAWARGGAFVAKAAFRLAVPRREQAW